MSTIRIVMFYVLSLAPLLAGAFEAPDLPPKLSLAEAERYLYENNLTVIAARHGVDANRAARMAATYTPNPNLTIGGEQIKTDRRLRSYAADTNTASNPTYTFRIDQLIETAGKKRLRTESAEMQLLASEAQVLDALRLQTLQMKQFYHAAVLARENAVNAKEMLESISKTEEIMTTQVKRGNIAELDVIKFQANRIQYERDVATAQLSYDQSVRDLINTLSAKLSVGADTNAAPKLELTGDLVAPETDYNLEQLHSLAAERADVIASKRALDAAEKAVQLSFAQRTSDVTIGGEFQRVGGDNTVGLVFSVPIPIYNNHKANINQAESQRNAAFAQYLQIKNQALTDIDKAYQTYLANQKIAKLYATQTLSKAKEAMDNARKAYDKNATGLLDLLDAQRTYKQTVQAAHQAQYDLLIGIAQLESATGKIKDMPEKSDPAQP